MRTPLVSATAGYPHRLSLTKAIYLPRLHQKEKFKMLKTGYFLHKSVKSIEKQISSLEVVPLIEKKGKKFV